jgi:hypothetical protein
VGLSPNGRLIVASGSPPNRLVILDAEGRLVRTLEAPEEFTSPKWSRDGRWLAGFTHPCKPPPGSGIERRFCGAASVG